MSKIISKSFPILLFALIITSCSTSRMMREPNIRVELNKNDFVLSEQVTGEAQSVKVLGIDWKRLFKKTQGTVNRDGSTAISIANIPVIGGFVSDRTTNYALYELMKNNPGYDVVIYPQVETVKKNFIVFSKTSAKVTARLGKLKTE